MSAHNHPAPNIRAWCHQCAEETGTVFKFMPAGIGNACDRCGTFRKGKPYIGRNDFNTLTRQGAKGGCNGTRTRIL